MCDGWQFISFFLYQCLKLMAPSTSQLPVIDGFVYHFSLRSGGRYWVGFLPALSKVWLSPRAESSIAQAVFAPQKPQAFLDFNHFLNRCISHRRDKVLTLALCSLKPKLYLVIKQCSVFCCYYWKLKLMEICKLNGKYCSFQSDFCFHSCIFHQN